MRNNFHDQLNDLSEKLVKLGSMVEEAIHYAIKSLRKNNNNIAQQVITNDSQIDDYQLEIEEDSIKLIALQQPVAIDLRRIISISRISNNLERIGDLAQNIAQISIELNSKAKSRLPVDLLQLADKVYQMVYQTLTAFVKDDIELAQKIASWDEEVDRLDQKLTESLLQKMINNPSLITDKNPLLFVSRYLERIADHATNICEQIIYMLEGQRIKY
ncbi:phosphate signaling complex protein PhoU [Halanaerocella petrolearia]